MKSFYKRVHIKLIELEHKRSWLLEQTGIKPSTWSSWEKYERIPPADRALDIANTLGVTLEFLISGKQTPFDFRRSNPKIMQICRQLLEMSEDQLDQVQILLNTISVEESNE